LGCCECVHPRVHPSAHRNILIYISSLSLPLTMSTHSRRICSYMSDLHDLPHFFLSHRYIKCTLFTCTNKIRTLEQVAIPMILAYHICIALAQYICTCTCVCVYARVSVRVCVRTCICSVHICIYTNSYTHMYPQQPHQSSFGPPVEEYRS
jgi:hypothetical protein